jgi:ribonuclease HII
MTAQLKSKMSQKTAAKRTPTKKTSVGAKLLRHDQRYWKNVQAQWPEAQRLIGVDEVGRGSLIGPVVSAAVCFDETSWPRGLQERLLELNDSKQLKPQVRQDLVSAIHDAGIVTVAQASLEEIETLNIHHASLLALSRAAESCRNQLLFPEAAFLILDGKWLIKDWPLEKQQALIKGDTLSAAIAAASIVAKEWRDDLMKQLAEEFPQYDWHRNMGYATPAHRIAIKKYGASPYHRKNFHCKP